MSASQLNRKKVRVLHIVTDRNLGGAGILLTYLLKAFDRERFCMDVALYRAAALRERIPADCRIFDLPANLFGLQSLIAKSGCDIAHTHACAWGQIAAWMQKIPCVATRHCVDAPHPLLQKGLRFLPPFRHTHWIAVSEECALALQKEGVRKEKITTVQNGVPTELLLPSRASARQSCHLKETDFAITFVGRLEHVKGPDLFLQSVIAFCRRHPNAVALLAGDGSMRSELQAEIAKSGFANRIRLLGFCPDPATLLCACDLFVNASRSEAHSLSMMEAMRAGIPIVASDLPGNREVLRYGGGVLFSLQKKGTLLGQLESLYASKRRRNALGEAGKQAVSSHFSVKNVIKDWQNVYESLLRCN